MRAQENQRTAKNGQVKLVSKISLAHVLGRILIILLFLLAFHILSFLLFLIPLIGLIPSLLVGLIGWLVALYLVISLLIYCFSHTVITTDGIYGRDRNHRSFDVCFDQIQYFERSGTKIIFRSDELTGKGDVTRREHAIRMINSVEFEEQYKNR